MVKYEWDESNGVSVPTNKLMVIDAEEYYVGMPLKKVDAETVAPTDGDPEYICLAQRNAGDEIRPLQIPVQEVFPDAVYTKILEDGTEEKVKFGGGGEPDWNASEGEEGYIKNRTHYDRVIVHDSVTETIVDSPTVSSVYGSLPNYICNKSDIVMPEGKYILIQLGGEKHKVLSLPPSSGGSRPVYRETITLNNGVTVKTELSNYDPATGKSDRGHYFYRVIPISSNEALTPYVGQTYSVSLCEDELKKLDPKFLPDGYPYEKEGLVEIIPEMKVTVVPSDELGAAVAQISSPPNLGREIELLLESDRPAIVKVNGIEYECVPNFQGSAVLFGNLGLADGDPAEGSEYPFVFSVVSGQDCIFGTADTEETEYTFSFGRYGTIIETINPKFLPKITIVQDGYDDAAMGVAPALTAVETATANATFLDVMQMLMTKTLPPVELYAHGGGGISHYFGGEVRLEMSGDEPHFIISFYRTHGSGDGHKGIVWYYGDDITVGDY